VPLSPAPRPSPPAPPSSPLVRPPGPPPHAVANRVGIKRRVATDTWRVLGNGRGLCAGLRWRGLLALNYHRIGDWDVSPLDRGVYSTRAEDFDAQMAFLAREFDVVTLDDLDHARRDPKGRYVMVTFDDGYRDNYDLAFPILKRHNIPGTFFITTGFIDDQPLAWWDRIAWTIRESPLRQLPASPWWGGPRPLTDPASRERAIEAVLAAYKRTSTARTPELLAELTAATGGAEPPPGLTDDLWVTWDHVRELHRAGMGIGAHTHTHPLLARLDPAEQVVEIRTCKERLLAAAGVRTPAFAYPVGSPDSFNALTRATLLANDFDLAFSFYGGYQAMTGLDPLDIRRTSVNRFTTQPMFEAKTTLPRIFAR